MDDTISVGHPNDGDVIVEPPAEEGSDTAWTVPDEDDLPKIEDAEPDEGSEGAAEAGQGDENEPEGEPAPEPDPEPYKWDGNPESLPPELKPVHEEMVRGMNQKFRELAELRKQYEQKLEKAVAPSPDADKAGPPPFPADDATPQEWREAMDARARYFAEEAAQKQISEIKPSIERQQEQISKAEGERRYMWLTSQPGFTPEVEARMIELSQEHEMWGQALQSDEGTRVFFDHVKNELAVRKRIASEAKRKKAASKQSVSRPTAKGKVRPSTPADNYASTFDELGKQAANELGIVWD